MIAFVVALICAEVQARSLVTPIAPSYFLKSFSAENSENDIKSKFTVGNEDDLENALNLLFNFAIGLYPRFDAEDIDDCIYPQFGRGRCFDAEEVDDKKINLDEIAKIAGQTQQIIQILKSQNEDFENGLGKKLRKLGRRISRNVRRELPKVTEIAGKVNQIGQVLGYDVENSLSNIRRSVKPVFQATQYTRPHLLLDAADLNDWTVRPYRPSPPHFRLQPKKW